MEETIDHLDLCVRIKDFLTLEQPHILLEVAKIVFGEDEIRIEYLGDSLYSWKQNQDL